MDVRMMTSIENPSLWGFNHVNQKIDVFFKLKVYEALS